MANRAKKLIGGYKAEDLVQVSSDFQARRTPPPHVNDPRPYLVDIPQGTLGIIRGIAGQVSNALDVEFDLADGFVRVETELNHIARI